MKLQDLANNQVSNDVTFYNYTTYGSVKSDEPLTIGELKIKAEYLELTDLSVSGKEYTISAKGNANSIVFII